jgi:antibiotic biosynthesis monooxygenase (ABM) superfamily enzyme
MSENPQAVVGFEYIFEQEVRATMDARFHALNDTLRTLASQQPGFIAQDRELISRDGPVWRYRTTVKFDTADHCVQWLDHPERRRLLNLEEKEAGFAFHGHGNWEGYARWLPRQLSAEPPKWKVNLLVLLTLYPTAMLLTPLLHFVMRGAGLPISMLVSNAICVAATSWVLVPFVSRFYLGWLSGESDGRTRAIQAGSLAFLLAAMFLIFQMLPAGFWN